MNPNLQAVLEYLSRTDYDGTPGGITLVWALLGGLMLLFVLATFAWTIAAASRGPLVDASTRTVVRRPKAEPGPEPAAWNSTHSLLQPPRLAAPTTTALRQAQATWVLSHAEPERWTGAQVPCDHANGNECVDDGCPGWTTREVRDRLREQRQTQQTHTEESA